MAEQGSIEIIRSVADLRGRVVAWRQRGDSVGLVPTMGALHAGHLALVTAAQARCRRSIVTLFVNPKQFENSGDLKAYPRTEAADAEKLTAASVDVLYAPQLDQMYPDGFLTNVSVAGVGEGLCGAARAGHFDGVATVVAKLLLRAEADVACFGEKDYQQLQVVRAMARDLDIRTEIVGVPTVREADGLALSSRNVRLTPRERQIAPTLYRVLSDIAARVARGETPDLESGRRRLQDAGFGQVDYVEVCDAQTLKPARHPAGPARVFGAAWLGTARLIDNVPVADAAVG